MRSTLRPGNSPASEHKVRSVRISIGGLQFDWLLAILSGVFVGGLYLDGWAHNHGKVDQSFFTPWHGFFYGAFVALALALIAGAYLNHARGLNWRQAIPNGYQLSAVGILIFAMGGIGDLVWHGLFGIEEDFEALLSPTHLTLGLGLALIVTGPLRAAWRRTSDAAGWRELGPALLSLACLISALTFFMMFAHPITSTLAGASHRIFRTDAGQAAGVFGSILMTALLLGPVLVAIGRWRLPIGGIGAVWAVNTVAMTFLDYSHTYMLWMAGAMILAGFVADWLLTRLRLSMGRAGAVHIFAFAAPVLLYGAYFGVLMATEGTRWSVHLWTGTIVLVGIGGWLLSFVRELPSHPISGND